MAPQQSLASDDLHALVLLYLSVAYDSDHNFDPSEEQAVLNLLCRWMPDLTAAEAKAIVDTALQAVRSGMKHDVEALARSLGAVLPAPLRRRVLTDLGQIALADGFLSVEEATIICRVRAALDPREERMSESEDTRR